MVNYWGQVTSRLLFLKRASVDAIHYGVNNFNFQSYILNILWYHINSLTPGGFDYSLKLVNFKLISLINILSIFCEIAIRWMPQHLTDHESTLVQIMAWCRQATSHYLSQCWPRSLSPYDITRPQWVNPLWPGTIHVKLKKHISILRFSLIASHRPFLCLLLHMWNWSRPWISVSSLHDFPKLTSYDIISRYIGTCLPMQVYRTWMNNSYIAKIM